MTKPVPVALRHHPPTFGVGLARSFADASFETEDLDDVQWSTWLEREDPRCAVVGLVGPVGWHDLRRAAVIPSIISVAIVPEPNIRLYLGAIRAGADGVAHFSEEPEAIAAVTEAACNQRVIVPLDVWRAVGGERLGFDLSDDDIKILRCLSRGMRTREVAATVSVSSRTARRYVTAVCAKMGAASIAEAVAEAHRLGLIE